MKHFKLNLVGFIVVAIFSCKGNGEASPKSSFDLRTDSLLKELDSIALKTRQTDTLIVYARKGAEFTERRFDKQKLYQLTGDENYLDQSSVYGDSAHFYFVKYEELFERFKNK